MNGDLVHTGSLCVAQRQGIIRVLRKCEGHFHAAGNHQLVRCLAKRTGIIQCNLCNLALPAVGHVPVLVVGGLHRHVAGLIELSGQLAVHELVLAHVFVVVFTGIVLAVNIAKQVIVHYLGCFNLRNGDSELRAVLGAVVKAGQIQLQGHIGIVVGNRDRDIITIINSVSLRTAFAVRAAPVVSPGAVGRKLHLIAGTRRNLRISDLINAGGSLGHLVGVAGGVPAHAVQPGTIAVADRADGIDDKLRGNLHALAGDGNLLCGFVKSNRHIADGSHVEGDIVTIRITDPILCAVRQVLHNFQLIALADSNVGESLGVNTAAAGHDIGRRVSGAAFPNHAAQVLRTSHHIDGFLDSRLSIGTPGAFSLVPGSLRDGIAVGAIRGQSQVAGLVPLVIPVVFGGAGIHSAEDDC